MKSYRAGQSMKGYRTKHSYRQVVLRLELLFSVLKLYCNALVSAYPHWLKYHFIYISVKYGVVTFRFVKSHIMGWHFAYNSYKTSPITHVLMSFHMSNPKLYSNGCTCSWTLMQFPEL
jgi:hypothetical protein